MDAAQPVSASCVNIERLVDLAQNLLKVAGLDAVRRGAGIAMHRIAAPQHRPPGGVRGFDQGRQKTADAIGPEAMNQRQPARLVVWMQDFDDLLQRIRPHPPPDLEADRIAHAAKEFHVRAARIGRAHPDPGKMRRKIVPTLLARHAARLRLLVKQV